MIAKNVMFEIIKRAEEEGWSINNINTDLFSDNVTNSFIRYMYPELRFKIWDRKVTAIQPVLITNIKGEDFYARYPMFWEVRKFLIDNPSDILLIATREGGKEHQFLQLLKYDEEVDFKFACVYDVEDINGQIRGNAWQKTKIFFSYIFKATLNQFYIALDEEDKAQRRIKFVGDEVKEIKTFNNLSKKEIKEYLSVQNDLKNVEVEKVEESHVAITSNLVEFFKISLGAARKIEETWEVKTLI